MPTFHEFHMGIFPVHLWSIRLNFSYSLETTHGDFITVKFNLNIDNHIIHKQTKIKTEFRWRLCLMNENRFVGHLKSAPKTENKITITKCELSKYFVYRTCCCVFANGAAGNTFLIRIHCASCAEQTNTSFEQRNTVLSIFTLFGFGVQS